MAIDAAKHQVVIVVSTASVQGNVVVYLMVIADDAAVDAGPRALLADPFPLLHASPAAHTGRATLQRLNPLPQHG